MERYRPGTATWPNGPVVHSSPEKLASRPAVRHLPALDPSARNYLRRFFGFVAGIRPTLLAQTGLGTVGADHLARDGRVAWQVAMETLAADANVEATRRHRAGECSAALDLLIQWIRVDLQVEALRWQPAEMALRHLRYVLTVDGPMRRQDERCVLLGIWGTTLSDLVVEVRSGEATLGSDGPALSAELDGLAEHCLEADLVRVRLGELAALADTSTPSPLTYPMAPPCSRNDLRTLLTCSQPPSL